MGDVIKTKTMKYLILIPFLGCFIVVVWAFYNYVLPDMHRRILPMLKALIIILMVLLILYGFFIFGLEYKDQQEIINYLKR